MMTTTRTPTLTRRRKQRAVELLFRLREEMVPDLVTAREAASLCDDYGMLASKYQKMRPEKSIRLIDVAVYIARHTTVG